MISSATAILFRHFIFSPIAQQVVAEHFHDDMDYNIVIGQNPLGLHLDDDTGSISYDWGSYGIHILLSRT